MSNRRSVDMSPFPSKRLNWNGSNTKKYRITRKDVRAVAIRFYWSLFVSSLSWSAGGVEPVKLDLIIWQMFLWGVVIDHLLLSENARGKNGRCNLDVVISGMWFPYESACGMNVCLPKHVYVVVWQVVTTEVEVALRPTFRRPVSHGVRPPSGTRPIFLSPLTFSLDIFGFVIL
jgi:hypothetical protein